MNCLIRRPAIALLMLLSTGCATPQLTYIGPTCVEAESAGWNAPHAASPNVIVLRQLGSWDSLPGSSTRINLRYPDGSEEQRVFQNNQLDLSRAAGGYLSLLIGFSGVAAFDPNATGDRAFVANFGLFVVAPLFFTGALFSFFTGWQPDARYLIDPTGACTEHGAQAADYLALRTRFQPLMDAGRLRLKLADGRVVIELPSDVLFASGFANLSSEGRALIREIAKPLAENYGRSYQVGSHTDNVPNEVTTGATTSNWELASERAVTVVKSMVDAGVPPNRLSAAGFGDSKPAVSNDTEEGRKQNRRIEIVVVPDPSSLPNPDGSY